MSTTEANSDPFKRHATGHRGVVYRIRSDGSRTYYVYTTGRFTRVEGGEEEARAKRAELAGKATPLLDPCRGVVCLQKEASPIDARALPRLARPLAAAEARPSRSHSGHD